MSTVVIMQVPWRTQRCIRAYRHPVLQAGTFAHRHIAIRDTTTILPLLQYAQMTKSSIFHTQQAHAPASTLTCQPVYPSLNINLCTTLAKFLAFLRISSHDTTRRTSYLPTLPSQKRLSCMEPPMAKSNLHPLPRAHRTTPRVP